MPPVTPQGFDELYQQQWRPMLRVAVGLVDDTVSVVPAKGDLVYLATNGRTVTVLSTEK